MKERVSRSIATPDQDPVPNQDELPIDPQPEVSILNPELPEDIISPEVPDQPLTPEQQQDAANRFTDAELLGRSFPVQRLVSTIGNERVHAWERMKAGAANACDKPGKLILQGLHSHASYKVDMINLNHKADRDAALKAGGSKRLLQHRLNRIDKKYNRKKEKWGGKLDRRKQSLNTRVNRMKARTESVKNNYEKRRAETIAHYKAAKVKAEARKSLRNELFFAQGASLLETFAIMRDIPQSERKRIGETALLAQASHKSAKTAERTASRSERQASRAEGALLNNVAKSEQLANRAKEADQTIDDISNVHLPKARENLSSLQEQLGELPEDSHERTALQVKIQEAEDRIKIYEERELPYWHSEAKNYREQVNTLLDERTVLQQTYQSHQETAARHHDTATSERAAASEYARQHNTETNTVLNSEKESINNGNS